MPAAVVFAASPLRVTARLADQLARLDKPFVVAADAGAATALAFGLRPDVVLGDFDSIDATALQRLRASGVSVETFSRDKDFTDGELAILRALEASPSELLLLGFVGGPRLDQTLANILQLQRIHVPARMMDERNECRLLRGGEAFTWQPSSLEVVSLLPLSEPAFGVMTEGLRWRLNDETLHPGDTRGVSNEPVAPTVRVSLEAGQLLVTRHFPD